MYDDQRNRGSQNNEIYVNGRPVNSAQQHYYEYDEGFVNDVMIRSFMFMFMAVLVTAIVALYTAQSGLYRVIFSSGFMLIAIVIAEFACVIFARKSSRFEQRTRIDRASVYLQYFKRSAVFIHLSGL